MTAYTNVTNDDWVTTTTHPSAAERLAASLHEAAPKNHAPGPLIRSICQGSDAHLPQATAILAADPTLASDIEDGTELRLLREALPERWYMSVGDFSGSWTVGASDDAIFYDRFDDTPNVQGTGPTLAAAAKACREALEATR